MCRDSDIMLTQYTCHAIETEIHILGMFNTFPTFSYLEKKPGLLSRTFGIVEVKSR